MVSPENHDGFHDDKNGGSWTIINGLVISEQNMVYRFWALMCANNISLVVSMPTKPWLNMRLRWWGITSSSDGPSPSHKDNAFDPPLVERSGWGMACKVPSPLHPQSYELHRLHTSSYSLLGRCPRGRECRARDRWSVRGGTKDSPWYMLRPIQVASWRHVAMWANHVDSIPLTLTVSGLSESECGSQVPPFKTYLETLANKLGNETSIICKCSNHIQSTLGDVTNAARNYFRCIPLSIWL
jgi:hypothetical protein